MISFLPSFALIVTLALGLIAIVPIVQAAERYDFICVNHKDYGQVYNSIWARYPEKKQEHEDLRKELGSLSIDNDQRRKEIYKEQDALMPEELQVFDSEGQEGFFSELVNNKLAQGWSAQGGMSAFSYVTGGRYQLVDITYCQSFVK